MKLYEYRVNRSKKLVVSEQDGFEEKPKTYRRKEGIDRVIRKDSIGRIDTGYFTRTLCMMERDDQKAKEILLDYYRSRIESARERYEAECNTSNYIIDNINNGIEVV